MRRTIKRVALAIAGVLVAAGMTGVVPGHPAQADELVLPAGFFDQAVADFPGPTDMDFAPDGRLLLINQHGQMRIFQGNALVPTPALDIAPKICTNRERGLTGLVVDPNFATNHWIYLYYTFKKHDACPDETDMANMPVSRLSRFTLPDTNVVDPATELVLVDDIPSPMGIHHAGDLEFAPDGTLFMSVGDGGCPVGRPDACTSKNDNAQRLNQLMGKILRINADGSIPGSNPWAQAPGARRCGATLPDPAYATTGDGPCAEIWAYGLRNPFRFAFQPGTSRFYINDVGQSTWEEIDEGARGANYGWNVREGHCKVRSSTDCGAQPKGMTNPIYDYNHKTTCTAATAAAWVPEGVWPAPYSGSYLFADFTCGKIFRLAPKTGGGFKAEEFVTNLGYVSVTTMKFGPMGSGQALYYLTYQNAGQLRRITFGNPEPSASFTPSVTEGPAPLAVTFNGAASGDPKGGPLTYRWSYGDGASEETVSPTVSHTYAADGSYQASLRVVDQTGFVSAPAGALIEVGNRPSATITAPPPSDRFAVGQQITLSGSATDAEDGPLPDSALSWEALLHHDQHTHPFLAPTSGNNLTISYPQPEGFEATASSYVEVRLTATDSSGLRRTVSQNLLPKTVEFTVATNPTGLKVTVDKQSVKGTTRLVGWVGQRVTLGASSSTQKKSGKKYKFSSWSDRQPRNHEIVIGPADQTITAKFKKK